MKIKNFFKDFDFNTMIRGVQFKLVACFVLLIFVLVVLLNSYPIVSSRDIVFSEKQSALLSRASSLSTSLSTFSSLSNSNVSQVVELLDFDEGRIIVTDTSGIIVFDSGETPMLGRYAMFSEIFRALSGEEIFYSNFEDAVFISRASMPVVAGGVTTGAVYISEYDYEQAELIISIQERLQFISLTVCLIGLIAIAIISKHLSSRMRAMLNAIRITRSGDYGHRIKVYGKDELALLADEFNSLSERLEQVESQRRRFVSDASHELKTPLASIRLLSDSIVMSEGMDIDTMREFVTDIGTEAERLQRTTDKLLQLSRRDDNFEEIRVKIDLGLVAKSTLRLLYPLADERGIKIELNYSENCEIEASEEEVYHIIFNLVENAIKYNVDGGEVSIDIEKTEDMAILRVSDTGIGIPNEDRASVFSRFYRVDKARARDAGGSGLGLSIVEDTVHALRGEIELLDEVPTGISTCFELRFPIYEEVQDI